MNQPASEPATEPDQPTEDAAAPAPTVWGTLQADDAPALIAFLVDTFGFRRTAVYADGDTVAHAQLDWPEGGGIMLGSHAPERAWSRQPGTAGFYVVTDRPDQLYARVQAAGATVIRPLEDQDYGSREFAVADPEGNLWSFGTYRGEATASEHRSPE
ncbi:VOC family protein [Nakamurella lactea]|uniref:VOC family protein n=1 Tax=Nakamurella lactea TaxID=459515 RepID=UPI000427960A|nr:VOC family protein [Nakamurella lactea]